jgi:hypothetical protein
MEAIKRNTSVAGTNSTSITKPEILEHEDVNLPVQRYDTTTTGGTFNTVDFIEIKTNHKFIWFVVFSVSIGGFLFGYDTGISLSFTTTSY